MKNFVVSGIVAGIVTLVVGMGLNWVLSAIFPSVMLEYQNPAIFRPWSDPLMWLFFLNFFVVGIVLAWWWKKAGSSFQTGTSFGFAYWLLTIPGMLVSYSSFQISLLMVLTWTVMGLVNALIMGWIFAKFLR